MGSSFWDQQTLTLPGDRLERTVVDADALAPGDCVGRYVLTERVGSGGMAVVYRAVDRDLDRAVAVKVLRNDAGRRPSPARRRRMLREAQAAASISHPNVVAVYDVGEHDDLVYIAMEFVPETLSQWLAAKHRPWHVILELYLQAGRGLAAAHHAGFLHRDFKPSNVLLSRGRARVADFGLAREICDSLARTDGGSATGDSSRGVKGFVKARLTETGARLGTPGFMAPEQFLGHALDPRADQFALCVALYHALYKQAPFAGDTPLTLERAVTSEALRPAPTNSEVPRWIFKAVARGLRRDPAERWPSLSSLLARLAKRSRRRGGWIAIGGLAVGVAAAAVVGLPRPRAESAATPQVDPPRRDARVAAVEQRLVTAAQYRDAGRLQQAHAVALAAATRADAVGHVPLVAAAHLELGRTEVALMRPRDGARSLERAYFAAAEAGEVDRQRAAAVELAGVTAKGLAKPDEGLRWARLAFAEAQRQGAGPLARAEILTAEAIAYRIRSEPAAAIGRLREALQIREALLSVDDIRLADSHSALGKALLRAGVFDEAELHLNAALDLQELVLGPDAPEFGLTLNALGVLACEERRVTEGVQLYRQAYDVLEAAVGPDHPALVGPLQNLGNYMHADPLAATHYLQRALVLLEQTYGDDHPLNAGTHVSIGNNLRALGRLDEAEAHYQRAMQLVQSATGEKPATCLLALGSIYDKRGDFARAVEFAGAATKRADDDPSVNPIDRARVRGRAAALIWRSGQDPERALAMVALAQRELGDLGADVDANLAWVPR